MKKLHKFLIIYLVFISSNFVYAMVPTSEEQGALQRMRDAGNSYSGKLYEDESLTLEKYYNPFWRRLYQGSQAEKNSAINDVLKARSLLPYQEFRRHIAAGISSRADINRIELCNAVDKDDIPLTRLFLPFDFGPKEPVSDCEAPIYWARSVAMAKLLYAHGLRLPQSMHHCMKKSYHPELILFYAARRVNLKRKNFELLEGSSDSAEYCNVMPFQRLILCAKYYGDCPFEALKKAALLKKCGADVANVEYVFLSTSHMPIICPVQMLISSRIKQIEHNTDSESLKHKKVLEALLAFVEKPKSYRQVCIEEFAGKKSITTALRNRELGIKKK